jgi:uncharacterized protein (TIGR02246 family)
MTRRLDGSDGSSTPRAGPYKAPRGHDVLAGLVGAYLDGELAPATALEVELHVAGCAACGRALQVQRAVRERLRSASAPEAPVALRDRIFDAIAARPVGGATGSRGLNWAGLRAIAARLPLLASPGARVAGVAAALIVVALLAYRSGRTRATLAPTTADSAAIVGLMQAHAAAWNHRDPKAAAALLTRDAVWVTSGGVELRGRAEIEHAHAEWLALDSAGGGSTHIHPPETFVIRFLRPDVAVADLDGQFLAPTGPNGRAAVREEARIFVVATKDAGGWRIAHLRNIRRYLRGPSPR